MKKYISCIHFFFWGLCLIFGLFFFSCAGQVPRTVPPPSSPKTAPVETLPQIGASQAAVTRKTPRPDIVDTLTKKAEQQIRSKDLDKAFATLEQALGIDSRDPFLWHLLAQVQLLRGNMQQAEHLARKSNSLGAQNPSLMEKNEKIITKARGL